MTSFSRLVIEAASMRSAPRRTFSPARKAAVICSCTCDLQRGVAHVDSPPVLSRILLALASIAVVCIAYGVAIERRAYRLVRRGLAILPADGPESVTVLHLSDLHFVSTDHRKRAFLASIPRADVTVVTGDFLAEPEAVETAVDAVRETRGRLASWFVLGSNDYYAPHALNPLRYFVPAHRRKPRQARRGRSDELRELLSADGWEDLTNRREELELGGLAIELLGLDDAHIRRQDLRVAPRRTHRPGSGSP